MEETDNPLAEEHNRDQWCAQNGYYDDGNLFSFEDIGEFDHTEALAMLKEALAGE